MATLNKYVAEIQTFLRDSKQDLLDPQDIINNINRARREIALRTQCVRVLTPITGAVIGGSVVSGGSGYTSSPTITLTAPDFPSGQGPYPTGSQGSVTAVVSGGSITGVNVSYGGAGYWQPSFSITDATGTGATVTPTLNTFGLGQISQIGQGQEVLNFSDIDLIDFPGVQSVYAVQSVSLLYSGFRYSLICYSFSTYQALIRVWASQWRYVPCVFAQHGQGTNGTLYCYPVPSQSYQVELDCYCLPQDLLTDLSVEAIPAPWDDAIVWLGASYCYMQLQNANMAKYYDQYFKERLVTYSNAARVSRATSPYGRYGGGY